MRVIILVPIIVVFILVSCFLYWHYWQAVVEPRVDLKASLENMEPAMESKKAVENYIVNSAGGSWDLALQYLTGEALDRARSNSGGAGKAELLSSSVNVIFENDVYAEVSADVGVRMTGSRMDRKNYLFRLRKINGEWKIFDQQLIPFTYGPEKGSLNSEKKKVITEYLNLSVAGKWEEASKHLAGVRRDVKKVETGGMEIKDIELEQLAEKDGRSLIEARYTLKDAREENKMRVTLELMDIGGKFYIAQAYKVEG